MSEYGKLLTNAAEYARDKGMPSTTSNAEFAQPYYGAPLDTLVTLPDPPSSPDFVYADDPSGLMELLREAVMKFGGKIGEVEEAEQHEQQHYAAATRSLGFSSVRLGLQVLEIPSTSFMPGGTHFMPLCEVRGTVPLAHLLLVTAHPDTLSKGDKQILRAFGHPDVEALGNYAYDRNMEALLSGDTRHTVLPLPRKHSLNSKPI